MAGKKNSCGCGCIPLKQINAEAKKETKKAEKSK